MKSKLILLFTAVLSVVLVAGFSSMEVQAEEVTPEASCKAYIEDLVEDGIDMGSFWENYLEECWLRTSVEGSSCYPAYEVWDVRYYFDGLEQKWEWESKGCVARYNRPKDSFRDPSSGFHYINKPAAGTFEYGWNTCDGLCRIAVHTMTYRALELLEEAPARVLGKAYIQILDGSGNVDYGEFTFCMPAKGARSPVFYRLGAGHQWYPILNGHWEINLYCMQGEMSGNYILVDMFYRPD